MFSRIAGFGDVAAQLVLHDDVTGKLLATEHARASKDFRKRFFGENEGFRPDSADVCLGRRRLLHDQGLVLSHIGLVVDENRRSVPLNSWNEQWVREPYTLWKKLILRDEIVDGVMDVSKVDDPAITRSTKPLAILRAPVPILLGQLPEMVPSVVFEKALNDDKLGLADEALEAGFSVRQIFRLWIRVPGFEFHLEVAFWRDEALERSVNEGMVLVVFVSVVESLRKRNGSGFRKI